MTQIARTKIAFGDFQTPSELATKVCDVLYNMGIRPQSIIEPTCGEGNFLIAATEQFTDYKKAIGIDISLSYVEFAQTKLKFTGKAVVKQGDFFHLDWKEVLEALPAPLLVIGNPPWVTNATLGTIGSDNLPQKSNFQNHTGLDAITGKSNFDISEWMLLKMLDWLNGRYGTLTMLCKTSVARKVLKHAWKKEYQLVDTRIYSVDAWKYFDAAVEACLLVCRFEPGARKTTCEVFSSLDDKKSSSEIGYKNGIVFANQIYFNKWIHLFGTGSQWRSGIKHDCSKVMELRKEGDYFVNGLGEKTQLEDIYLYPMLKSSELVNGKQPSRWMIVTQKNIGEDTSTIKDHAPKTWKYLTDHVEYFVKRGSSIYLHKPQFSVFGVGDYSFSPWKVAISALYKRLEFSVIGSYENKPIVLDDTQNFLPCRSL